MAAIAVVAGLVIFGLLTVLWYVHGYNRAVAMEQNVKQTWAQVDVVLERRFALIPNLVATVQGYATHEKAVFENVAMARTQYMNARGTSEKVAAASLFDRSLANVLALAENYPQLKADGVFRDLQAQLEGTENRISYARQRYIGAVYNFNVTVRSFPSNLTAMALGYVAKPGFSVANEPDISTAPRVKIN